MVDKLPTYLTPGVRYMLLAAFVFSALAALVKSLSHIHVLEILFFRSGTTALLCMFFLKRQKISFIGNNQKLLLLRTFFGMIGMACFFITLQRMPMGASVSLKYLSPIFTAVFAVLFLTEKVKPIQWLFFLGALAGVFLLKGFDARIDTLDLFLGILGAMAAGLVYVIIRKIGQSEHPIVIVNYYMLTAAILSGLAMIPFWQNPTLKEWIFLISLGILGYFGQVYMTKAFQIEAASRVAQIRYIEVIYSLIIGLIWFGEGYNFLSFLGILLILGNMVLNVVYKAGK